MPKMPKTRSVVSRKKRPKSVYSRGWETRRRNQERENAADVWAAQAALNEISRHEKLSATTMRGASTEPGANLNTTGTATPSRSEASGGDALLRMRIMHRDDQLCGFVAEMATMRRMSKNDHMPLMMARAQLEAIEDFLIESGFTPFGRR